MDLAKIMSIIHVKDAIGFNMYLILNNRELALGYRQEKYWNSTGGQRDIQKRGFTYCSRKRYHYNRDYPRLMATSS
jgi:hypothetical protein